MKYDVYVAGPFFRPEQIASMERLESALEKHGLKMFRPRFDSVNLQEDKSEEARKKAFEDDVAAIHESEFMVANTMNLDAGTLFEVGYAYAIGKPVYGFVENLPPGAPFNIMLAHSMAATFLSVEEVDTWLTTGESQKYEGNVE